MKTVTADKLPQEHSTEFQGLPIIIEWPRGSTRVGTNPDGTTFKTEMKADYGYIPDTTGVGDGEKVDIYRGEDEDAKYAYIVEQLTPEGEFDEYKIMLGFPTLEDAEEAYTAHVPAAQLGDISEVEFDYLFDVVREKQQEQEEIKAAGKVATDWIGGTRGIDAYREGDSVHIDMMFIPEGQRFGGRGTKLYQKWESKLPKDIKLIRLDAADTGTEKGNSGPFWEKMGFDYVYADKQGDETDNEMWKGINGNPTPKSISKTADEHKYTVIQAFIKNYEHEVDFYQECAALVQDKLDQALQEAGIKAVVSSRAKRPSRLEKKLLKRDKKKHYQSFREIYDDIIDLAGCRVALYMPADRDHVGQIIQQLFVPVREAKHFPESSQPEEGDTLGYVATHYLVRLRPESLRKKELRYADTQVEIQVASVLMHAWAEVTHDLIYKPEKGKLAPQEMKLLNDLNQIVQAGEAQLEKLQEAIEGRTSEDLRFEIAAALANNLKARSMGDKTASLSPEDVKSAAEAIADPVLAGKPPLEISGVPVYASGSASYFKAIRALQRTRWKKHSDEDDDKLRAYFERTLPNPGGDMGYVHAAMDELAPGRPYNTLTVLPKELYHQIIERATALKTEAIKK